MVAYWSGAGTAFDGKKTSITKFLPLGGETGKPRVSDEHRESFNKAMQEYKDKVNG